VSCRDGWSEGEDGSTRGEPLLNDAARKFGIAVEEADADGEDGVEVAVSRVEVFECRDEELGFADFDLRRVSAFRGFDHLR